MSLYSLVAFSAENKLVGFAAFDDNPMATIPPNFPRDLADKAGRWAVQAALDLGYRREMLLWVTLCAHVVGHGEDEDLYKAILSTILVLSTDTMVILETSAFEAGCIPSFLKQIAHYQKEDFKLTVCACRRSFIFPKLIMRRAREEDHDNLTPVIEKAQARGIPLTQVPASASPSEPYAMARLIAAQTKLENVFVAEVQNRMRGVIALTSDIDLPDLHANYVLDTFEGLKSQTIERRLTVIAKKEVDKFFVDPLAAASSDTEAVEIKEEGPEAPTVEYFIRWPENVFRITMLCVDEEYESRAIDMIDFAFSKLNKEFCLLTLPYNSPYLRLLRFFYRVPARLHATNKDPELSADTRCLYLLHVDALSPGFAVKPFAPADASSLGELLDNFPDKERLVRNACQPPEGRLHMVAVLSHQVIGFVMLDNVAPVGEIASHFDLESVFRLMHHDFQNHASIVLYVLNPVYRFRSRLFIQEIMRQTQKSVIYCPVFPQQDLPDILEDLVLVTGRQHAHMSPACDWGMPPPEEDKDEYFPAEIREAAAAVDIVVDHGLITPADNEKAADVTAGGDSKAGEGKEISPADQKIEHAQAKDGSKINVTSKFDVKKDRNDASHADQKTEDAQAKDGSKTNVTTEADGKTDGTKDIPGTKDGPNTQVASSDQKDVESDGKKTDDASPVGTENHIESSDQKAVCKTPGPELNQKKETVDGKSNNQKVQGVSDTGSPELNQKAGTGDGKNIPGKDQRTSNASPASFKEANDQNTQGDSSETAVSPLIERELPAPPALIRRRGYYHGFDCALFVVTRRFLYRFKTVINARIVIVGSSLTTAGFLHQLLASHELQFTNLIMVSPVGFKRLSSTALSSLIADSGPKHQFPKLGLDCQVKIILAAVTEINRKDHIVRLSNGRDLPYDWLVLSSGLQDQTKQSLGEFSVHDVCGVVRADELVLNAHEIAKGIAASAGEGGTVAPVVVYGATLEAYGAIQALMQEGLEGKDLLLIHPETEILEKTIAKHLGDEGTAEMILTSLIQAGLSIHSGMKLVDLEMNSDNNWIQTLEFKDLVKEDALDGMSLVPTSLEEFATVKYKSVVAVEAFVIEAAKCHVHKLPMEPKAEEELVFEPGRVVRPERKLKQPCSLLVTCDKRHVDLPLFRAIHKEALIFDGRIVVDGYFQTNDPFIFAAGSLCKFSRHCGDNLPKLEYFCPWEVGEEFTSAFKSVIVTSIYGTRMRCASQEDITILPPHKWPRSNLPALKKARCIGGLLAGEQWFLSATAPKFCTPTAGAPAMSLVTQTTKAYCRLDIMDNKEVGRIVYFGKNRLEEWKIVSFVGLPETLLNNIVQRWEKKEMKDLADFLLKPWASVIFHDRFPSFFQSLSEAVRDVMRNSRKSMTVFYAELEEGRIRSLEPELTKQSAEMIHKQLMIFLKNNEYDLPKYQLPPAAA